MKNVFKIFTIFLLLLNYSCTAQQMVQTPDDAYKLKSNEQQFINKPLKNLLKEVKPEIKTGFGEDYPSFFTFKFFSPEEINREVIGRKHISFYVYVKEIIDWNPNRRPKGKEYIWTKEDLLKYGDLTVIRIKVIERTED